MRFISFLLSLNFTCWIYFSPTMGIFPNQEVETQVKTQPINKIDLFATLKTTSTTKSRTTKKTATTKKGTTIQKRTTTKKTTKKKKSTTTPKRNTTKRSTTIKRSNTTKRSTTTTKITTTSVANNISCKQYGLNCEDCGLTDYTPNLKQDNLKIVGGQEAIPFSLPSQILLVQSYNDSRMARSVKYFCGGTLIKPNVVLTAAHCFNIYFPDGYGDYIPFKPNTQYPTFESTFDVYAAVHNISFISSSSNPSSPGVSRKVIRAIMHPSYIEENSLNDIALLILDKNITLNSYVKVACLPPLSSSYPPENTKVIASGWGRLSFEGSLPYKLQNVMLTNYNSSMCKNVYSNVTKNWKSQICAGEIAGGKDTCQGDSGGPLYYREIINGKERLVVAGITSYGDECALPGKPGIYTRTSYYIDWIQKNI